MTATLVLLPGMDGTGQLFAPLLAKLPVSMRTKVVAYTGDQTLGYEELIALAANARRMQEASPQARLVRLLGPHFLLQARAEASAAAITAFVDEVVQGGAQQRAR